MNLFLRYFIFFEKTNKFQPNKILKKITAELKKIDNLELIELVKKQYIYNNFVHSLVCFFKPYTSDDADYVVERLTNIRGIKYIKQVYVSELEEEII